MAERRSGNSTELVYSESDLARFREAWRDEQQELERNKELVAIRARLDGIPELVRSQARQVVQEVLAEQATRRANTRRWDMRLVLAGLAAIVVLIVPVESAIISQLTTGHP